MSDYKLEFKLKQHTPIIHFQWEQKGATIRPPELKSKLDKWIIQRNTACYGLEKDLLDAAKSNNELKQWIKGSKKKDHPALDYKIRIDAIGENLLINEINPTKSYNKTGHPILRNNDYPQYFGNQLKYTGDINHPKEEFLTGKKKIKRLTYYHEVRVVIESVHDGLLKEIKKEFPVFLLHTNFGTRQSKGFGSFYLHKTDECFPQKEGVIDQGFFVDSFDYCFDINVGGHTESERVKNLFVQIDFFYKTLRGGINPNDTHSMYFKSLMWKYAKSLGKQWEKKTIKQYYLPSKENVQKSHHSETNSPLGWDKGKKAKMPYPNSNGTKYEITHMLWRDLLGLSSNQRWMSYSIDIKKESLKRVGNKSEYTRFKSPIFLKPIRTGLNSFRIFLEVPKYLKESFKDNSIKTPESEILGEWFKISTGFAHPLELPFPLNFDYDEFFKCAFSTNPSSYVKDDDFIIDSHGNYKRKEHGRRIGIKDRGRWVEIDNPAFISIQSIFDQLAYQVELKTKHI